MGKHRTHSWGESDNSFGDTAFMRNRDEPMHQWVPWVAGFSSAFVADVFRSRISTDDPKSVTVMDPFAGVGTTLVEALRRGHNAIGFEINPFAALASRVKLDCVRCDLKAARRAVKGFFAFMEEKGGDASAVPRSRPPGGFRSRRPFFSPNVERQVLFVRDFISARRKPWSRDLFRLALGSLMVGFSNYSYEPSLSTRAAAGKADILDADVAAAVVGKLDQMIRDMEDLQHELAVLGYTPNAVVHPTSFLSGGPLVPDGSVDLVVTSPPYLNNYHYVRNTRPHLYWLDLVEDGSALKDMEHQSFGKFWQTVRSGPDVPLDFEYPELEAVIGLVRTCNEAKGVYGGRGWANYAASYFNDCARLCRLVARMMKPGGTVMVVIGNNILQGIEVKTDAFFAGIANRAGLETVALHPVRKKRTGSSIVNSSVRAGVTRRPTELYETAVELRTPAR